MMIKLRKTPESELDKVIQLEAQADVNEYITPHTLEEHLTDFHDEEVTYLTIEQEGQFIGFIILVDHPEDESVECLRIALAIRGQGIGQTALKLIEEYSKTVFHAKRIWLDVFEYNARAIHVYQKLGYRRFDSAEYKGKKLLYLEKML